MTGQIMHVNGGAIWDREAAMLRGRSARLFGGAAAAPPEDPVEYNGYRIRPTPFPRLGQ